MVKNDLNQNAKYTQILMDTFESDFIFENNPIDRFRDFSKKDKTNNSDKNIKLLELKKKISSIENCNLKNNAKNLVLGDGNIYKPISLIGEAPGADEDNLGLTFQGDVGVLLEKMLIAINLKKNNIYSTYSVNYRPPEDRKPTAQEIKRYSIYLKEHIKIINPKIIVLMGSTAMEAITGINTKISNERGKWKEIILENKTIPIMITFSPSYLIRFPENKKFAWEDLKKIKNKIKDLNINI